MTDTQPFMDEAHAALCELCTAFVCPPEEDCHCALTLRKALSSAYQRGEQNGEQRGREEERERVEDLEDVLSRVKQWCDAYPLDIFPEPDFKRAHELLTAGGMTLDAISASSMRHVCTGISKIIATSIRTERDRG